jgi:hypothetical protein
MSVFTATTTYDFIAGWRKLFRAGCACWIPGGAFCIAGSWLAVGRNCGPEKGSRAFFFLSGRAAGCTPGGSRCVAASWLAWPGVLQYSQAAVFFVAVRFSLRQRLGSLAAEQYSSRERGSDWRVMAMLAISSGAGLWRYQ